MSVHLKHGEYEVEIMADSFVEVSTYLEPKGYHRITSIRSIFPRIVLSEFNTHRLMSRNSASSRAIPISKMIESIQNHPFVPDRFPKTHKGMQANEWVNPETAEYAVWQKTWLKARDIAVTVAKRLDQLGMSKQLVNRILEPFLMHQVIVTATEWENFLALRANPDAQNEIMIAANLILEAMNKSEPKRLNAGQWHLPFGDQLELDRIHDLIPDAKRTKELEQIARQITVARCARVSYRDFNGKDDYEADVKLFNRLVESGHWSPFEHVARAMTLNEYVSYAHTSPGKVENGWCGNFRGFVQMRKTFEKEIENLSEPRLKVLQL